MAAIAIQQLPHALPLDKRVASTSQSALLGAIPSIKSRLSTNASVLLPADKDFAEVTSRFSSFKAPNPGAVICPATEADIVNSVKWATANGIRFLARAGGHWWSTALSAVGPEDVLINLRQMNRVHVDESSGTATISAGATTGELLSAAQSAGVHIPTTACQGVGAIPAMLAGGIGNLTSNYGLACDNILSARVVTANGSVVTASQDVNPDLFWGLRGAGSNFGIVSELTVKTHPLINGGMHWGGMLGFSGSRDVAEAVVRTVEEMGITRGAGPEGMWCTVIFGRPAPAYEPTVLLKLSFNGTAAAAHEAFRPIYDLTSTYTASIDIQDMLPTDIINQARDLICPEGGTMGQANRPVHASSVASLDAKTMGDAYQRWEQFTEANEDAKESLLKMCCYDYRKVREVSSQDTAFAWREMPINVLQMWAYTDSRLDKEVQELGKQLRQEVTKGQASVMVNWSTGDEKPEALYGEKVQNLRALRDKWDPVRAFSWYSTV